ncbi:MAG: hypothetical protein ACXWBO_06155 [Ilumatobacteraceae bacterium]
MASGLIEVSTPRPTDSWSGRKRSDGPAVFETFVDSGLAPMAALAYAVAALHPSELLTASLTHKIPSDVLRSGPKWLPSIGDIVVTDVQRTSDTLGDGENLMISWRWPAGLTATMVVYIDHNMGTVVKDAFVVPEGAAGMAAVYERIADPNITLERFDAADARARIHESIEHGDRIVPPLESEQWPQIRPLLEFLLRLLPQGGAGFERPSWPDSGRRRLLDEFAASDVATLSGLDANELRELADPLIWFACDYGPGDPLRWSPVSVEVVLADWYPRKVLAPAAELVRLPEALAALIRYAHDVRGVPADLTTETLAAVERWRGHFDRAIRQPGRSSSAYAERRSPVASGLPSNEAIDAVRRMLVDLVGSEEALASLDDVPLGDVPFHWRSVPSDIRAPTEMTLAWLDRWAVELFDAEVRTIARAVLAACVDADPGLMKRSHNPERVAAAILWVVSTRIASRFSRPVREQLAWKCSTQKELATAMALPPSAVSSRVTTIRNVVERADIDWPSLLHSAERRNVLETVRLIDEWRGELN